MLILSWRAWAGAAAGALLAGATLATLLVARAESPAEALAASVPALLLTAALVSAATLVAAWAATRRYRHALDDLTHGLAAFRVKPSSAPLVPAADKSLLGELTGQVELLAASYRKALADL